MRSRTLLAVASVAVLASLLLGIGIGGYALYEPDEARHAEIGREMLEAPTWRGWLIPTLGGEPYRNKPAPFYWLLAASYAWLGVGEQAARLVSVVAGVLTAVAVSLWAARVWGPRTAVLAGIVLLTAPEFFLLGRFVTLDMMLTLWVTLGTLAVHRFARRGGSLVPAAVAGACGLLSKGLLAPGLIALTGLVYLARAGRLRLLTPRTLAAAALAFVAVALPWHVAAGVLDADYLRTLFIEQQWDRAVDASGGLHPRSVLFYVPVLLGGFFPWSALLPATLRGTLARERRDDAVVFSVIWAAVVFAVFSLARGKVASYILPVFPPLALLTARFLGILLAGLASGSELALARGGLWVAVGVCVLAPLAAIVAGAHAYGGALLATSLWSLLLLLPAVGLAWLLRRGRLRSAVQLLAAASVALMVVVSLVVAPGVMEIHSDATLARVLRAAAPAATAPVVAYHVQSSSLRFYLRRPVLLGDRPAMLRRLLAEHPVVFVVTSPRHVPELLRAGPFVPWHVGARRVLYASVPPAQPASASP